jgi:hypothetical protein
MSSAGDWNSDGVPDVAIAREQAYGGSVYQPPEIVIISGANGSTIQTIGLTGDPGIGPASWGVLRLLGTLDANTDGLVDLAFTEHSQGSPFGRLRVRGSTSSSDLASAPFGIGAGGQGTLAGTACIAGDVSQDGVPDLVVATEPPGVVQLEVRSGSNGQLLNVIQNPALTGTASASIDLCALGDVNADGSPEVAVIHDSTLDHVRAFSLLHENVLWTTATTIISQNGCALSAVPDLTGDGFNDLVVGDPQFDFYADDSRGIARVFDGPTGALVTSVYNPVPQSWAFGQRVLGLTDVNGDGRGDFLAEGRLPTVPQTGTFPSQLQLWSGSCGESTSYGSGCPGSGGSTPSLATNGCLAKGCELKLTLTGFTGGPWPVIFLLGVNPAAISMPYGCDLLIAPPHVVSVWPSTPLTGPGTGSIGLTIEVPALPPIGQMMRMQAICADPFIGRGYSVSNGLTLKF